MEEGNSLKFINFSSRYHSGMVNHVGVMEACLVVGIIPTWWVKKRGGESFWVLEKGLAPVWKEDGQEDGAGVAQSKRCLFDAQKDSVECDFVFEECFGEGGDVVGVVFVGCFEDGVAAEVA